jgi:hypothetical protein
MLTGRDCQPAAQEPLLGTGKHHQVPTRISASPITALLCQT